MAQRVHSAVGYVDLKTRGRRSACARHRVCATRSHPRIAARCRAGSLSRAGAGGHSGADAPGPSPSPENKPAELKVSAGGYLEAYYQAHFQDPSNRITNLRGYDSRSRSFTLSNVALDVKGEKGPVTGHIILQIGHTPSTAYLAEPFSPGTGSVNGSSGELWNCVAYARGLDRI